VLVGGNWRITKKENFMKCPECEKEYTKDDFTGYIGKNDLSAEIVCSGCGCECHIGTATQADFDE